MIRALLPLLPLVLALPAGAEPYSARFDLSLRGVTGGQMAVSGDEGGGRYAVSAAARPTGIAGRIVRKGYEGRASGRIAGGALRPEAYIEVETEDGAATRTELRLRGGRVADVSVAPAPEPEPWDVDPAALRGVGDPLTALYSVIRPQPASGACGRAIDVFDGRRVARLTLGPPRTAEGGFACAARYDRRAGYSAEELAERDGTRFEVIFATRPDGRVEVVEMRAPTSLGTAVLRRR